MTGVYIAALVISAAGNVVLGGAVFALVRFMDRAGAALSSGYRDAASGTGKARIYSPYDKEGSGGGDG